MVVGWSLDASSNRLVDIAVVLRMFDAWSFRCQVIGRMHSSVLKYYFDDYGSSFSEKRFYLISTNFNSEIKS